MDWREKYHDKIVEAGQAVRQIRSGDTVVFGHACGEPSALVAALVNRAAELQDVELIHMVAMGPALYARPEFAKSFRHNGFFLGAATRAAVREGRADFTPCYLHQIPKLFRERIIPVDAALIQVSPPDEQGRCSFGISVDYTAEAARSGKMVIAQVNRYMPRTGGTSIDLADIDWLVAQDEPLLEMGPVVVGRVEQAIGQHIAALVLDGATLQLGIGAIPEAVLLSLGHKKDLGIHTEMFSDGVVALAEAGVVTNKRKTLHPDKFIATFVMGTRRLYDFVDCNPAVELYPADYINDPWVIGQNERMISINSALQVDLTGQVNAETIGGNQFSGIGGQVDFVRGAGRAKDGRAIIALPSTAAKGQISRIVCRLDPGAAVSTSRNDVQYIATEYGIADLRGTSLRQRAEALIAIAHPDYRAALRQEAWATGLW